MTALLRKSNLLYSYTESPNGAGHLLVTDEPVEVQDFRKLTDAFTGV